MAEAEAALLAAAKCLKSGWFKKPDHEAAASEYEKAATAFRTVKAYPRAVDAFCKASAEHEQFDSGFMACKHLETAAFLAGAGGLKQPAQSADLYERSVALHRQDGRVENACEALGKAARVLEPVDMARGAALAIAACDLYDEEISGSDVRDILLVNALEAYKLAVPLLLRAGRAAAAAGLLRRQVKVHVRVEQPHNVARCELSAVVCLLVADDYAAAATACDAAQLTGEGFSGTYEAEAAAELLEAFASQDAERVAAALANQTLSMLDHQIAQAARKLSLRSVGVPRDLVRLQGGGSGGGGSGDGGGGGVDGAAIAAAAVLGGATTAGSVAGGAGGVAGGADELSLGAVSLGAAASGAGVAASSGGAVGEAFQPSGDFGEIAPEDNVQQQQQEEEEEFDLT